MIALIVTRPIRGKTFNLLFEQSPFSQTISFMILPITSSMKCILKYFFDIRVDQLNVLTISTIDSPSTSYQCYLTALVMTQI